ncbi:hypothetical protein [Azospirillum sp.]|uniref:hypothetical protein n=1 Tax=Azospirillum sp. TaxID=34012 RepID=UPI002D24F76B|nr:hypothetical protein [Azospirillum sp.]HYD67537.1 hypothetical protein [Azospirillum sp.]
MKPQKVTAAATPRTRSVERAEFSGAPVKKASPEQQKAARRLFVKLSANAAVSGWKPYVKAS